MREEILSSWDQGLQWIMGTVEPQKVVTIGVSSIELLGTTAALRAHALVQRKAVEPGSKRSPSFLANMEGVRSSESRATDVHRHRPHRTRFHRRDQ
jgi:hypothetical protein